MSTHKRKKRTVRSPLPQFRSEEEEQAYWSEHEVVDYFDWDHAFLGSFPSLKPSTRRISLRVPKAMLEELKVLANERNVPYQALLKIFLAERIAQERHNPRRGREDLS